MPIPEAPVFTVQLKPSFIELEREVFASEADVSRIVLLQDSDSNNLTYDSSGNVWSMRFERPASGYSAFTRFITRTIYNPICRVAVTWTLVRQYHPDELRQHFLDAIAADDDVLTQFVEPDELRARVRACSTFQDFVTTWEWQAIDTSDQQ